MNLTKKQMVQKMAYVLDLNSRALENGQIEIHKVCRKELDRLYAEYDERFVKKHSEAK